MSVQINCDRCGDDTKLRFLRGEVKVTRGIYAATSSKISPANLPWQLDWHLCDQCYRDLQKWSNPPDRAAG